MQEINDRTPKDRKPAMTKSQRMKIDRSASVVRPSVRLKTFCANRFFYQTTGWIATKLAHNGPQRGQHPEYAQGQGQSQRSRDTGTLMFKSRNELLRH